MWERIDKIGSWVNVRKHRGTEKIDGNIRKWEHVVKYRKIRGTEKIHKHIGTFESFKKSREM